MKRAVARGFTLVEVLIASALIAVIGLAVGETLRASRDADRRVRQRAERRAHDQVILERLARDLQALLPPVSSVTAGSDDTVDSTFYAQGIQGTQNQRQGGRELLSLPDEETRALAAAGDAQAPPPPFDRRDKLQLVLVPGARRFGSPWPSGTGSFQQIVWEVDDDPATPERGLVRRPVTVQNPISGAAPEPPEVVGPNAVGLALRYFDGTSWLDVWDSTAANQGLIPRAIEASVAVRDEDGTLRRLLLVVSPLSARPSADLPVSK